MFEYAFELGYFYVKAYIIIKHFMIWKKSSLLDWRDLCIWIFGKLSIENVANGLDPNTHSRKYSSHTHRNTHANKIINRFLNIFKHSKHKILFNYSKGVVTLAFLKRSFSILFNIFYGETHILRMFWVWSVSLKQYNVVLTSTRNRWSRSCIARRK